MKNDKEHWKKRVNFWHDYYCYAFCSFDIFRTIFRFGHFQNLVNRQENPTIKRLPIFLWLIALAHYHCNHSLTLEYRRTGAGYQS